MTFNCFRVKIFSLLHPVPNSKTLSITLYYAQLRVHLTFWRLSTLKAMLLSLTFCNVYKYYWIQNFKSLLLVNYNFFLKKKSHFQWYSLHFKCSFDQNMIICFTQGWQSPMTLWLCYICVGWTLRTEHVFLYSTNINSGLHRGMHPVILLSWFILHLTFDFVPLVVAS